jgi:hypothetical protein
MIGTQELLIIFVILIIGIICLIIISLIETRHAAVKASLRWISQKKEMLKVKSQKKNLKN